MEVAEVAVAAPAHAAPLQTWMAAWNQKTQSWGVSSRAGP